MNPSTQRDTRRPVQLMRTDGLLPKTAQQATRGAKTDAGKATLPFLMRPNGESGSGRFDDVAPDSFGFTISARESAA